MKNERRYRVRQRPLRRVIPALWVAGAIPELVLHFYTTKGGTTLWNSGVYFPVIMALVPALALYGLAYLLGRRRLSYGLFVGYSFLFAAFCGAQIVYYQVFDSFFSVVSMVRGGGDAMQFTDTIFISIFETLPFLLLLLSPAIYVTITARRMFAPSESKFAWGLIPLALAVAVHCCAVLALPLFGGTGSMSAYDLYHNVTDKYLSVNKLGFGTSFRLELQYVLTGNQPDGEIVIVPPPTNTPTEPNEGGGEGTETQPQNPIVYNMLDIDFEKLIQSAPNNDVKQVHQFFKSQTATAQNEYTGIFKGCNLVFITAEAFSAKIITPERTPTLYKMMSEGMYLDNFYVPYWDVSTCDGEYANITGTLPKKNAISFQETIGNYMPLTMSMQLIKEGYKAYAYHGYNYNFYKRHQYMENMGYEYKAYKYGLPVTYMWPVSDKEVVDLSTGYFANSEPFITYYMTISGHLNYSFSGNNMCWRNRKLAANEPYSEAVRAYIACQLEFEFSMQLLMERLEAAGTLDNTVFVITADHYPYGLKNEEYSELFGHTIEKNFERYQNGCIIYKPGMTPVKVDTLCSSIDLLPTLSNLFGLEFDSRLYMGRDIFSEKAPLVMFNNRSWITEQGRYNSVTGEALANDGTPLSEDYVKYINNQVSNRFTASARILDYDYWRILFGEEEK